MFLLSKCMYWVLLLYRRQQYFGPVFIGIGGWLRSFEYSSCVQVKNSAGSWITAAPIPDTFVCNIGDMMRIWTNGLYEPTLHRVANADRSRSRVSLPFFYEPAFDTVVTPIPGLHGSSENHMLSPKHYGRHLESKVFSNFEL